MEIQKIAHAQQNWEVPVNQNFANLSADSGWISLPVLAPFGGTILVRKFGSVLEINGSVVRTENISSEGGVPIANIPANLVTSTMKSAGIIAYTADHAAYSRLIIYENGQICFFYSSSEDLNARIRIDKTIIC